MGVRNPLFALGRPRRARRSRTDRGRSGRVVTARLRRAVRTSCARLCSRGSCATRAGSRPIRGDGLRLARPEDSRSARRRADYQAEEVLAGREARSSSRSNADAVGGVVGLLRATARERVDEAALGRREGTADQSRDRKMANEGRSSGEAEALEVAALDLFGDGIAGEEGKPEPFAGCAFDRFARAEFPLAGATHAQSTSPAPMASIANFP